MTISEDTVRVYLRNCTVRLLVGIYDKEKAAPQPVVVSIEVTAPLDRHYDIKSNDISTVINYETLHHYVVNILPALGYIPLLESVAERIFTFCFEDSRIQTARVTLHKPQAFSGTAEVGIELYRRRPA